MGKTGSDIKGEGRDQWVSELIRVLFFGGGGGGGKGGPKVGLAGKDVAG